MRHVERSLWRIVCAVDTADAWLDRHGLQTPRLALSWVTRTVLLPRLDDVRRRQP